VLDRIAPTASPRSALIISDEPLHKETNYRTEFVVALNNQPQGGILGWLRLAFQQYTRARRLLSTLTGLVVRAAWRGRATWHAGNAQIAAGPFPAQRIGGLASL
jgi:hypothetical protein